MLRAFLAEDCSRIRCTEFDPDGRRRSPPCTDGVSTQGPPRGVSSSSRDQPGPSNADAPVPDLLRGFDGEACFHGRKSGSSVAARARPTSLADPHTCSELDFLGTVSIRWLRVGSQGRGVSDQARCKKGQVSPVPEGLSERSIRRRLLFLSD